VLKVLLDHKVRKEDEVPKEDKVLLVDRVLKELKDRQVHKVHKVP
jgi:hypothetical protein